MSRHRGESASRTQNLLQAESAAVAWGLAPVPAHCPRTCGPWVDEEGLVGVSAISDTSALHGGHVRVAVHHDVWLL